MHHDLGALGAAVNRRALERQLEIMKSMGVNAIRTSHNPPAPELLELTDRMGLLVMDEAFDMWEIPKVRNGLSKYWKEWFDADLREFIRRDRNHPSVVLWSIGNEIPEQGRPDGGLLARKLTNIVHEEDRTRPTTAGFNNDTGAIKNELAVRGGYPGLQLQAHQVRARSSRIIPTGSSSRRRLRPPSVRAASTTCRSRSTRSIPRCNSPATT